jgi:hypothetical protein
MNPRFSRSACAALMISPLLSLLVACGSTAVPAQSEAPKAAAVERGTLLADEFTTYPRVIRQSAHRDAALNGRLVASVTANPGGVAQGAIYASTDEGRSFRKIGAVIDPLMAKGHCCGTLYELPRAIGALPAGTLLYSSSLGQEMPGTAMENRIYASTDGGVSWNYLSLCGKGRVPKSKDAPSGIWEPEFAISADGRLVCYYSDETLAGHSQILVQVVSSDGINWSAPQTIVAQDDPNGRPGMAVVRKLPNGTYFLTYENCYGGPLDCRVRAKRSANGLDWGPVNDPGTLLQTADGQFLRHAPTVAWAPVAGSPNGKLLVIGQIVFNGSGTVDTRLNGRTLFTNTSADGSGPWTAVPAPLGIPVPPQATNWCQNYSTPLLPSVDGKTLFVMHSDGGADQTCRVRFGSGAL